MVTIDQDAKLRKNLEWLGLDTCCCEHAWKGLGRLHGVSMGHGWVRMNSDPRCPHHGRTARRRDLADQYDTRAKGADRG